MAALNIVSLQEHWLLKLLCFCYDVASPATTSAQCVTRILSSSAVSSCLTRGQASGTVAVPWCSTKCGRNALYNRAALLWNSLPACLRSSPTKLIFKTDVWKLLADPEIKNKCMSLAFSPLSCLLVDLNLLLHSSIAYLFPCIPLLHDLSCCIFLVAASRCPLFCCCFISCF